MHAGGAVAAPHFLSFVFLEVKVTVRANTRPVLRRGLSREEAAVYVGVSPSKFDELRKDGRIGPPKLIDGRKVWDILALDRDFDAFPTDGIESDDKWDTAV